MTWEGLSPPYQTIVADPPWAAVGTPGYVRGVGRRYGQGGRRRRATSLGYSTMSIDAIMALPVASLAGDGPAHLYLWTLPPIHAEGVARDVARAWGFESVGEIIWRKPNFGLGAFPRPQHEILLVARRGVLPFTRNDVGSVQSWPQVYAAGNGGGAWAGKVHSAKPHAAYDLIESASPGPYVDLFCRQPRLGWDSWGWGYEIAGEMAK